ncbi:MAG: SIR2 family protein [Ignavibacteria bacterium]|nr:SIR2 family protein [Ignavibacteria bacterium]
MPSLAEELLEVVSEHPEGWNDFAKSLRVSLDLEQALHDVTLPTDTVEILVRATWKIVAEADIAFYHKLLSGKVAFPLSELFAYLLRTADAHLNVVTTNYDRVAEYAANNVGAYASTGLTSGWLQRFVAATVVNERPPSPGYEGMVSILKVHGSLDWFRDSTGDVIAVPAAQEIPRELKPLVVTPGVTKYREVHKDPFRTVMSAADAVLRTATCYVCIGYGFNDEHVQPILVSRVLKNDVPVVIITKELTVQTRNAFLDRPPKHFLFIEESSCGTKVYTPTDPFGVVLDGVSLWQLHDFVKMVTGDYGDKTCRFLIIVSVMQLATYIAETPAQPS